MDMRCVWLPIPLGSNSKWNIISASSRTSFSCRALTPKKQYKFHSAGLPILDCKGPKTYANRHDFRIQRGFTMRCGQSFTLKFAEDRTWTKHLEKANETKRSARTRKVLPSNADLLILRNRHHLEMQKEEKNDSAQVLLQRLQVYEPTTNGVWFGSAWFYRFNHYKNRFISLTVIFLTDLRIPPID